MDRIDALHAYVRLVECRSFTQVARELRITQSTVSKWISALEEDVGVHLLDRTTRSLHVTEQGNGFYERAKEIVAGFEHAVSAAREEQQVVRGRIRLSAPVVFGRRFVVPLVATLLQEHPELEVEMVLSDRYVSVVEEGFDLAIRVGVSVDSSLLSHRLSESARYVAASPEYLKRAGIPKTPADLARHDCLVHTQLGDRTSWTFSRAGRKERVSVGGRVSCNNSEATLELAQRGLGVCLLASWLAEKPVREGKLVRLLARYEAPTAPVCALSPAVGCPSGCVC